MNRLGEYIVMGLGFIFFSMVELAIVLILKQKQEWVNATERITINKAESEDIFFKTRVSYYIGEGTTFRENERNMHGTKTQTRFRIRTRMLRLFHSLPLISKIDFVTFLLFHFIFFLVNCIYWPKALSRN